MVLTFTVQYLISFFPDLKLMLYLSKINLVIGYFSMNSSKLKYQSNFLIKVNNTIICFIKFNQINRLGISFSSVNSIMLYLCLIF